MRVTGGRFGGLRLTGPPPGKARPTEDRVRQALFNILGMRTREARVLDFFAGTGALGIEALSRGASFAVFIELDSGMRKVLRANLEQLRIPSQNFRILPGDALRWANRLSMESERFDLIFLDPPYESGLYLPALRAIADGRLVAADGVVVVEHSARAELPDPGSDWRLLKKRVYGETVLEFLSRES